MTRRLEFVIAGAISALAAGSLSSQAKQYPLETTQGLRLHNVVAEPATHAGKKGLRMSVSAEGMAQLQRATGPVQPELLATLDGVQFGNGVIEAEIAGAPGEGALQGARGFVGIAFRVRDEKTYDAFYLRPTNGRADDQERRNRSTQYIAHPDWPWFRLRQETPGKYESYVDLVPGAWTKVRIEVRGQQARLFVHDQPQPVLIVNDVKSGPNASGSVALWIGPGTVAHFRNLTIRADP